jgi:cytochrome c oxidase subunit 2
VLAAPAALLLAGCSSAQEDQWKRGGLPAPASDNAKVMLSLWQGAWTVALLVGAIVWALIIGACVIYRRKSTDTGLPPQVRYNLPVEVLYTTLPIVMVGVYFYFTAQDQNTINEVKGDATHHVTVVGKRWSWDFNYQEGSQSAQDAVYETGTDEHRPVLVLPVNEKVEFTVLTRDVIHSFWVTPFLYKRDLIPGLTNRFELTPTKLGTFPGKCAELCGTYHSRMLFDVKVVSHDQYEAELQRLRGLGHVGLQGDQTGPRRTGADIKSESETRP